MKIDTAKKNWANALFIALGFTPEEIIADSEAEKQERYAKNAKDKKNKK